MLIRDELKAAIEAVLFARGEKVSLEELSQIVGFTPRDIKTIMEEIQGDYNQKKHGIQVIEDNNTYVMCTKPEYHKVLWGRVKIYHQRLTAPALETLAIIAYQQPVSRGEIESIRGVRCDKTIHTLLEKRLIQEAENKTKPFGAACYSTTEEFLRVFGLASLNDLPELEEG